MPIHHHRKLRVTSHNTRTVSSTAWSRKHLVKLAKAHGITITPTVDGKPHYRNKVSLASAVRRQLNK